MAGWHYDLIEKIDGLTVAGIWDVNVVGGGHQHQVHGLVRQQILQALVDVDIPGEGVLPFLTVHQNRRWDEDFLSVKKLLDEDRLGDIFRLESRVHGRGTGAAPGPADGRPSPAPCRRRAPSPAAARSRNIHVYQSLEDLLADQSVDLVLVATPNDVHTSPGPYPTERKIQERSSSLP
mgnify:CR=1 FL=1